MRIIMAKTWAEFYTDNLRVRAIRGPSGVNWVIEKKTMFIYWKEVARTIRRESCLDIIEVYKMRWLKTGTIKRIKKYEG
jgi:hypothetical protein